DDGGMLRLGEVERFLGRGRRLDLVPPLADEARETLALGRLVIDHEDLAALCLIASSRAHALDYRASRRARRYRARERSGGLLLDLQVIDDAFDALRLPRELFRAGLLFCGLDDAVKVNSRVVGVNVHTREVGRLARRELGVHGGRDGRVIAVVPRR